MEVNYVRNRGYNPYSNTNNPGWRDHLNLKWGGNQRGPSNQESQNLNPSRPNASYQPPLSFRAIQDLERKSTFNSDSSLLIRVNKVEEDQNFQLLQNNLTFNMPKNIKRNPNQEGIIHGKSITLKSGVVVKEQFHE
ncbi:hypothetical protein E1A91_A11G180300v1 [Gossypium mustelinum]|uniref:Uncharacterized protein n=1 Tax=Gossypium mustelinum TaxID=34275 RepID=A0A5D2X877_GOSMU|nr:hypothetical protein E1A91_A11G180300v1 [Gossypium mustelinum]